MDIWHCIAERNDAIRRWAELEGKSPQMSNDIYRQRIPTGKRFPWRLGLLLFALLVAWAVQAWWNY